jgi:TRAP transporter 4TM/12TM fusion protein
MPDSVWRRIVFGAGLAFALFQLFVPVLVPLYDVQLRSLHVLLGITTVLLAIPVRGKGAPGGISTAVTALLAAVIAVANIRIFLNWEEIVTTTGSAGPADYLLGACLMALVLEAARRGTGWAIPLCVAGIFVYVFVGPYMPGIWIHPGFPLSYVIETVYYSSAGIYGSLTGTSATFIAMFILFGALLEATGGGQTFMELALVLAGRFKGGPAKVAVVASSMFGMISGSAVANVSVTGNYTIPLMKRLGYHPNFSGAVEAISSTGGGITPPVMGIAAFIMADLLGISYLKIIGYAAIPCLLFYVGIMAGVHFEALRIGLVPVPREEIPAWRTVFTWAKLVPLLAPIAVLLGLLFRGFTLMSAGFYACLSTIALYLLSDVTAAGLRARGLRIVAALSEGGVALAKIVPLLVSVSMFTSLLGLTGVAPKVSSLIIEMGGENLIGSLLVAAIIPLVLGAPLPVTATYILSAALIAPALIKLNIDVVAAHMFLLYWATLASVTPPTCTACVIGANLGGGNWLKVSFIGMRLGLVAFLMPFFFAVNPALVGRGPAGEILVCLATGLVGAVLLAAGFFGYLRSRLPLFLRGWFVLAGLLLLAPSRALSLAGVGLSLGGWMAEGFLMRRRARSAPADRESGGQR